METKIFPFVCLFLLLTCSAGAAVLDANGNPDPTDARMSLWLKADEGVTHDANVVSEWANMSDNDFNAVAPSGSEPWLTTETIGGSTHDVIYFDDTNPKVEIADAGTSDKLDPGTSDFYVFFVGRGKNYEAVDYSHKGGTTSDTEHYLVYQCCASPGEYRVRFGTGCEEESCKAGTKLTGTAEDPVTTTYAVLTAALDVEGSEATAKGWLNGDSTGWTAGAAGAADDVLDIGSGINTSNTWHIQSSSTSGRGIYVAETLIYKGTLTTSEREDLEGYLLEKYGLCGSPTAATNPSPANGAGGVDPNVILSWTSGQCAQSHDVYFGTSFADVNSASDPNTLPGRGNQEGTTYDPPGALAKDQTYYWRIDEVYTSETVKGDVWQFDTYWSPDPNDARLSLWLKADDGVVYGSDMLVTEWTNKSSNTFNATPPAGDEPVKTTDIIGGHSRHVVRFMDDHTMKLAIADAGTSDKLDPGTSDFYTFFVGRGNNYEATMYSIKGGSDSNSVNYRIYQCCAEPGEYRVRFGTGTGTEAGKAGTHLSGTAGNPLTTTYDVLTAALDVEGSTATAKGWLNGDPCGWAAGAAGAADDVLDIGSGINTAIEWYMESSGILGRGLYAAEMLIYKGTLSSTERQDIENYLVNKYDLRFANYPSPADGGEDAEPNVILSWKPGPGALSHDVYFGTSFDAVNNATDPNTLPGRGNQAGTTYDPPGLLANATTYYWRIDEVYSGETLTGDVWQFMVEAQNAIFETSTVWPYYASNLPNYRLPAIIDAPDSNDILVFGEKRITGIGDLGDIDIVMKRSTNSGATWGDEVILYNDGTNTCADPTVVVDSNTGRICLFFLRDKRETNQSTYTKFYYMYSDDDGNSWSSPTSIHDDVVDSGWASGVSPDQRFGIGPGSAGICKKYSPNAGRLIVPARHREDVSGAKSFAHVFYSDDGGSTWNLGGTVDSADYFSTECQLVELADGNIMINMRHADSAYGPDNFRRLVATSSDGGASWGTVTRDVNLIDVRCHASIARHTLASVEDANRLLFSNLRNDYRTSYRPYGRVNMSVRVSYDEGDTWTSGKTVWPYPSSYSDIGALDDMTIGLVYERGQKGSSHYWDEIQFARFNLEWLTNGQDSITITAPTVVDHNATNVTATSATLNGEVTSTGGENPTVHIYWGDNDGVTTPGSWDNDANLGTKGAETFYKDVNGLSLGTTYYYRCYAENSAGSDWADATTQFTTSTTLFEDGFDVSEWNGVWEEDVQNDWFRTTSVKHDGAASAGIDGDTTDATLTTVSNIDVSGSSTVTVDCWWWIDSTLNSGEYLKCEYKLDSDSWTELDSLDGDVDTEDYWHHLQLDVNSVGKSNMLLRFKGNMDKSNEDAYADTVKVTHKD